MTVAEAVTLIAAIAAAITSIAAAVGSMRNGTKIQKTHDLVNGQSHIVQALALELGTKQGEMIGRDFERRNPHSPPPVG